MTETPDPRTPWHLLHLVALDVEGNGARPPALVEIAVVPIAGGQIGDPITWLVKPSSPITWQATRVHGITNQDVAGCAPASAIADDVLAHLGEGAIVVAHNAHVDLDVVGREFPGFKPAAVIDTLKLSRRLNPERPGHKLGDLIAAYDLDADFPRKNAHRAGYDALMAARLMARLASDVGLDSLGDLTGQVRPTPAEPDALF